MKNPLILFYLCFICALFSSSISAQMHDGKYGNEWITPGQNYYKLKVMEDGFYRIDKQVLQRDISTIQQANPQQIQMYYMGQEIPIHVEMGLGGIEGISFYAEKKEAQMDVNMYRDSYNHLNPEYSLYSDTSTYFLTWSNFGPTKQYQDYHSNFSNVPTKEAYYLHESKTVFKDTWNKGRYRVYGGYVLSNGIFEYGEGYGTTFLKQNNAMVNTPHVSSIGPDPVVNVRAYSYGFSYHNLELTIGNHVEAYNSYYGDSVINVNAQIPLSEINSGQTLVEMNGAYGAYDKYITSRVSITYPKTFNFEGKSTYKFKVVGGPNKKYLEIDNFDGNAGLGVQNVYLYDLTNNLRIHCFWNGSKVLAELPVSINDRELVLLNENDKRPVGALEGTDFANYSIAQGNYIVITHPKLFTDSQGNNPVFEYCAYRASTGFTPVVVPIQRLYDQFSYGIVGHPMAVKNFTAYIKQHWQSIVPEYVFIIGKGRTYNDIRTTPVDNNLVPTFGYPASDNLLLAPINSDVPVLPVGRLAASNGDQVMTYLNKIKQLENTAKDSLSFEHQAWRKNIIHLGGGANSWEHNILKSHLLSLEPKMESGEFGANVHSFFKEQDDHIAVPNSQMIDSLVNNGVAMVTFFGHGSVKGFDYYLNAPEHYKNKDKYPLIMALGCYNGTVYQAEELISERFIFEENAGAAGYISFVDAVTISAASALSSYFYDHTNTDTYGGGIGQIIQKTLTDATNTQGYNYNPVYQMGCQYLVFHGDPALKLNYRSTPDFYIDSTTVRTNPAVITESDKNFKLEVDVYNLGKHLDSTLLMHVVRTHPSGLVDTCTKTIAVPKDKSKVEFVYTVNGYEDFGMNQFSIYTDANNNYQELPGSLAESNNNVLNYHVWVGNPVAIPVYPKEYAILYDSVLSLRAMSTNAFESQYTWVIEIDTTKYFNSPALLSTTSQSSSNLMEWAPSLNLTHEQVYYWRVQTIDANQQVSDWATSSFVYLNQGSGEGWNQSHVYQYQKDIFENVHIEEGQSYPLHFNPTLYEISAKAGFIPEGIDDENLALYQNGSKVDKCRCSFGNGVYVAVFDPNTLDFWTLPGGTTKYGAINCDAANRTAYAFLFQTGTLLGQQNMASFIMDTIPAGHLVVIYTLNNAFGPGWDPNLVSYMKSQGAVKIDSFVNTTEARAYTISFRKGDPTYPYFTEEVSYSKTKAISSYTAAYKAWNRGNMSSPLIGPAQSWDKLKWSATQLEIPYSDSVWVDVWGVGETGEKELLYNKIMTDSFDLSTVDATQYPYLQLTLNNKDDLNNTPAQLNYWRVYGDLTKDVALTVDPGYAVNYDSVSNTQSIVIDLAVWNMGQGLIDSSSLEYMIIGTDTIYQGISSLTSMDSMNVQVNIPLIGLVGQQFFVAKVKPLKAERELANNWGWLDFTVPSLPEFVGTNEPQELEASIENLNSYPNPFSTETQIEFDWNGDLPNQVSFEIYDTKGNLIFRKIKPASAQNYWTWSGCNQSGAKMPSGMYFCRILPMYKEEDSKRKVGQKMVKLLLAST